MSTHDLLAGFQQKELPGAVTRLGSILFGAGVVIAAAGYALEPARGAFNLLIVFLFAVSVGAGALFFVALEYIAGAVWSVPMRRVMEYLAGLLPVTPLIALPLFGSLHDLFHWTHAEAVAADPVLQWKSPYLNVTFFVVRFLAIFAVLNFFYFLFVRNSRKQDTTHDPRLTTFNIRLGAIFMPVFAVTMSVIAIDWMMSLEPHWFSTIIGVYYFSGSVLAALAAGTLIIVLMNEGGYFPNLRRDHYYSLGALLFAFTNFWAYIAFSQFMLIWYADLPEETYWFSARWHGGWEFLSIGLVITRWLIPYFALLSQDAKMEPKRLIAMSVWLLAAHVLDLYWLVMPTYSKEISIGWMELGFPILTVGLIMVFFAIQYKRNNLIPVGDPKLQRGLEFRL